MCLGPGLRLLAVAGPVERGVRRRSQHGTTETRGQLIGMYSPSIRDCVAGDKSFDAQTRWRRYSANL